MILCHVGGCREFCQYVCEMGIPISVAVSRCVGIDDQVTLGVVTASSSHGIHKTLGIAIQSLIGRSCLISIITVRALESGKAP